MSQNLWIEFDERIAALGTKADDLDTIKGRLEGIPQRLINVKAQVEILRESAQGIASKSVKTQIQKDISEKVKTLDNIFKKLEKTKTTSEPMLVNLEKALVDLENYTNTNGINSSSENTPEMNKPTRNGALPGWESQNRQPPPPFTKTNNQQFPNNNSSQLSSKVSPNQGPGQTKLKEIVKPPWNSSTKVDTRRRSSGGFYSSKKYSKDKYKSKGKMTRKGKKYSNSKKPKKNKFGYNKKTRNNKYKN